MTIQQWFYMLSGEGATPLRGAMVTDSATTTCANNTTTVPNFDTETRDDGGFFTAPGTLLTVPTGSGGWYFATFNCVFDLAASNYYAADHMILTGTVSGLTFSGLVERPVLTTVDQPRSCGTLDKFAAGGTFNMLLTRNTSGPAGTITIEAGSTFNVARAYSSAAIGAVTDANFANISAATDHPVSYNTTLINEGGLYNSGASTTRFTVPSGGDGWYLILGSMRWDSSGTASHRTSWIRKGGTTPFLSISSYPAGTLTSLTAVQVCAIHYMTAGEYVELLVRTGQTIGLSDAQLAAAQVGLNGGFGAEARYAPTTGQTVNAGSDVVMTLDTEIRDDGTMLNLGSNSQMTCERAGYYAIMARSLLRRTPRPGAKSRCASMARPSSPVTAHTAMRPSMRLN